MSSKNPFADDPLPENVVRLTSIADPLDPYAAPPGVNEYKTDRDPGVGMWREGKWLVMHREATFPPRCIFTNEPTETFGKQSITWAHLNDLRGQTVKLHYGLTTAKRSRLRWTLTIAIVVDVVAFASALLLVGLSEQLELGRHWIGPVGLILAGIIGGTLKVAWNTVNPLNYVRSKRSYVWLSGAGASFLDSLPAWPGFHG